MKKIYSLVLSVAGLALLVLLAGQLGLLAGTTPADLGVREGRLKPPSNKPNSVSSQAGLYPGHPQQASASIAPFGYTGDGRAALRKLASLLDATAACVTVRREAGYLYAQCRTPLLKYTDDVEFYLDEQAAVIHVRSASRLGYGDLGANRKRIEALRARFA